MLERLFFSHPASVGEGYFQHQRHAFGFAARLFTAAVASFVHGLVPALFLTTGSDTVRHLHDRMNDRLSQARKQQPPPPPSA
jgi:hypothetical protein